MQARVTVAIVGLVVLLAGCRVSDSPSNDEPTSDPTGAQSILDTTTTRAGTVREVLVELRSEIPGAIADYTDCVGKTSQYPRPADLPCAPYGMGSNDDKPAYGLLNLLGYVATGEVDALAAASGECADALSASQAKGLTGWALQDSIHALNDAFVVGYPDIGARLEAVTTALTNKDSAVERVQEVC